MEILDQIHKNEIISKKSKQKVMTKIVDYRRTFRSIHTKIRSIDKLDPSASFDEFSKVLFIKIINDNLSDDEKLTVSKINAMKVIKDQSTLIDKWFQEKVQKHYPGIFASNEKITLSTKALIEILDILDREFDLKDTLTDVKGRAFEEFLPSQLRGKGLGQYFTPRSVVDFIIEQADISINDKILDFASGSGGFLIKAFDEKKRLIDGLPKVYYEVSGKSKEDLLDSAKSQIFGIDAEPRAVRTAKMNMLLWGDGKQIQHGNGLDVIDFNGDMYLATEYDKNNPNSGVDVVLANPPFGSTEEEQSILAKYELPSKVKDRNGTIVYSKEKTENLFVEKAWKVLKPNGKLLIVLPEGIFSNKSSKTRDFILSHFRIETILKLPKHAFVMSGVDTINTVILIARKNTEERQSQIIKSDKTTWINKDYPMEINFASINQIGYEPNGKLIGIGYEDSDFKLISEKLLNQDYSTIIADPFKYAKLEFSDEIRSESWSNSVVKFLRKQFTKVPPRIDPSFYFFDIETKKLLENFINIEILPHNTAKIILTEQELNENFELTYKYVSVIKTIDGRVKDIEEKSVDEILSTKSSLPQKLFKGDIVFNPYRINTGSIIYIDIDEDRLITSPAYVVLRGINILPEYFVQLLKTPFMKYQIQILSSGSVRDNFGAEDIKSLKIPNVSMDQQVNMISKISRSINRVHKLDGEIQNHLNDISDLLTKII